MLVDRGHCLVDDRLSAQMLTYPDRSLVHLGEQAGAFPLPGPGPVALIREEIERPGQFPHVRWPAGNRARIGVTQGVPGVPPP